MNTYIIKRPVQFLLHGNRNQFAHIRINNRAGPGDYFFRETSSESDRKNSDVGGKTLVHRFF
jgi:hypothetical protein